MPPKPSPSPLAPPQKKDATEEQPTVTSSNNSAGAATKDHSGALEQQGWDGEQEQSVERTPASIAAAASIAAVALREIERMEDGVNGDGEGEGGGGEGRGQEEGRGGGNGGEREEGEGQNGVTAEGEGARTEGSRGHEYWFTQGEEEQRRP